MQVEHTSGTPGTDRSRQMNPAVYSVAHGFSTYTSRMAVTATLPRGQGLTLVHFSAQPEPFLPHKHN